MTGALAQTPSRTVIASRYSDLGEKLPPLAPFVRPAVPEIDGTTRDPRYVLIPEEHAAQQAHLQRLAEIERYPGIHFANPERLAVEVLRSKLFDIFIAAGLARRVVHLPYCSLGDLFKGRDAMLDALRTSLTNAPATGASAIVGVGMALHGLGGE
jgi:hypothetical protein